MPRAARPSSCTIFRDNYIHDNNNPNVPMAGSASLGPPGTGIVVSGGRFDTVTQNRDHQQRRLGRPARAVPRRHPEPARHAVALPGRDAQLRRRLLLRRLGQRGLRQPLERQRVLRQPDQRRPRRDSQPHDPGNCWHGNCHPDGSPVTSAPANLQVTHATCGIPNQGASLVDPLTAQVICATQAFGPCPPQPGMSYPRPTNVRCCPCRRSLRCRRHAPGSPTRRGARTRTARASAPPSKQPSASRENRAVREISGLVAGRRARRLHSAVQRKALGRQEHRRRSSASQQ